MDMLETIRASFDPKFYRRFRKPGAPNIAYRYYLILGLASQVLSALVGLATLPFLFALLGLPAPTAQALAWNAVTGYALFALLIFPWAYLAALGLRIAGAKCSFRQAFHVEAYSYTPALLLAWIPFISILGAIWSLVLWFQGMKQATHARYSTILGGALIAGVILMVLAMLIILPFALWYAVALLQSGAYAGI